MRWALKVLVASVVLGLTACQTVKEDHTMSGDERAAGTNRSFSHDVETVASAEAIWDLWTDVSTWKDWDKGLKDAELEGPMTLGARGKIIPLSGPAARFQVTEFDEGEAYAFETRLPFARLKVRRSFVSRQPVLFRHEVSFHGPLAGFWANRFGPGFRAVLPPTMATLGRLAEAREPSDD